MSYLPRPASEPGDPSDISQQQQDQSQQSYRPERGEGCGREDQEKSLSPGPLDRHHQQPRRQSNDGRYPSLPSQHRRLESVSIHDRPNVNDKVSPSEYFGESSAFDFIAKVGAPDETDAAATVATTGSTIATSTDSAVWTTRRRDRAATTKISHSHLYPDLLAAPSSSTTVFEELLGTGGERSNPFELPQRQAADKLVASYFSYRHPLNPYLHEGTFRRRYEQLWLSQDEGGEEAMSSNVVWLGLVNLVFAFGSEHAASVGFNSTMPSNSTDRDQNRFFRRAKMLVLSGILQTAKIELVQALLLLAHYLHGSLELNRCWTVVGLAVRTAQELGLYQNPSRFTADVVEQQVHKRTWWGCFALDRLISTKVGRPPMICDGPQIRVDLPLAVDDEFLNEQSDYCQPVQVPSKLEYFRHIVDQCRLVDRVLNTLFKSAGTSSSVSTTVYEDTEQKQLVKIELHDLLAMSIQLDGALLAWQDGLTLHLRTESDAPEWHFQRQRSVLLMRFLHTRLLIHRQTLLFYIWRPIADPFQLEIVLPCIKRCVMAASESITQMRLLRQHNSLSSFWHNSHCKLALRSLSLSRKLLP